MTQRDDLEPVGGLGLVAAEGGSVKSRRLGQICVGANTISKIRQNLPHHPKMLAIYLSTLASPLCMHKSNFISK
jgi:hypothetical protein